MKELKPPPVYDVVIVGAGLGGLLCGAILAQEGKKVCLLEKNKQLGGCLQTFAQDKKLFDSCVHYVGGLGEGHSLHQLYKWLGIIDELTLTALDKRGFDRVYFGDEHVGYPLSQRQYFIEELKVHFPDSVAELENYLKALEVVSEKFPLYKWRDGDADEKRDVLNLSLSSQLENIITNEKLRAVLCGNALLYAGYENVTPFYLHALVMNSYLDSAHKFSPGSSILTKALQKKIRFHGGVILREQRVEKLIVEDEVVAAARLADGSVVQGKNFISNLHPVLLDELLDAPIVTRAFRKRMRLLPQSPAAVLLNVVLKPRQVTHKNYNIYWHKDVAAPLLNDQEQLTDLPQSFALYCSEDESNPGFSETLSIMYYADAQQWAAWEGSYNTTAHPQSRGSQYQLKKDLHAEKILQLLFSIFPEYKDSVHSINVSSPLTFRDYKGTLACSLYGIRKDVNKTAETMVAINTKISNLFLTGENINMHGVHGVSITAVATCGALIGLSGLLKKLNAFNS